ncbi:MAG: dihydroxyacetone kinase subunit L [Mycoplasmatota bacterium]
METIKKEDWSNIFNNIANLMIEHKDELTAIDAKFGDGDHGVTVEKIANVIKEKVEEWNNSNEPLKTLVGNIGFSVTNVNGGSAGPLYGTYFTGLGECLNDEIEVDALLLKKMFSTALEELQYITTAKVGDKTMMDTLIPVSNAIKDANDDILDISTKAKDEALKGAEDSKNFVAKYGRARNFKEEAIGTPDAGALSCTYIFIGMHNALSKQKTL